ncbi:MAG: SWIM zinc finger family protein [Labilithrix sp.]|nr:SWIM zinc finger family protein [Labilithrix sp.]
MSTSIARRAGHAFAPHAIVQGFACHARGVELTTSGSTRVHARVRSKRTHDVHLRAEGGRLVVACTCPSRSFGVDACKHAWAALLEVDRRDALADLRGTRGALVVEAAPEQPATDATEHGAAPPAAVLDAAMNAAARGSKRASAKVAALNARATANAADQPATANAGRPTKVANANANTNAKVATAKATTANAGRPTKVANANANTNAKVANADVATTKATAANAGRTPKVANANAKVTTTKAMNANAGRTPKAAARKPPKRDAARARRRPKRG